MPLPVARVRVGCRRCGHDRVHHQHYRRGTDCSACACSGYRPPLLRIGFATTAQEPRNP